MNTKCLLNTSHVPGVAWDSIQDHCNKVSLLSLSLRQEREKTLSKEPQPRPQASPGRRQRPATALCSGKSLEECLTRGRKDKVRKAAQWQEHRPRS